MFKPDKAKSERSREIIREAFAGSSIDCTGLTLAYGYYAKKGIMGQKMYSYAIGFSAEKKTLTVIEIDSDGNSGEVISLTKENIESCKIGMSGDARIKSASLNSELRIIVPGFTPPNAEDMYLLPILQEDEAVAFRKFAKEF